jgi:tetratricopeptide (TPR) repeat protein
MSKKRSLDEVSTMAAGSATHDSFDDILVKVVRAPGGSPAPDELAIGTELSGRFTITRAVGAGGMGTVYVARDQTLGRDVAVKVHHASGGATRLRREAIAMARLAHPNVVTVFEVGEIERRPFVVMELITGLTLRAWIAEAPRTWREILVMLIAAGEGLAAAHAAGLVHRDFKPENVLVGEDGRARVGDFGLARELDSREIDEPTTERAATDKLMSPMTQTGAVLGTPAYMAPEQFAGAPVDPRADQFAFCVTVWEALWGQRPYPGATFELVHAAIEADARTPMPHGSKVPIAVRTVLERGLAKDPDKRYPTMRALLDALHHTLRRRRALAIGGGATLAVAAIGVAFVLTRSSEAPVISCDGAGAEIGTFADDVPAELRALGQPEAANRVEMSLRAFVADYRATAKTACESSRDWSPELAAKSHTCLQVSGRAAQLSMAADQVSVANLPSLIQTATRLRSLHKCIEPTYLALLRPVPSDPAQLEQLITARAELEAAVDDFSEHGRQALEAHLAKLTASPAHDDPTVAAGITYVRGVLARDTGKVIDAEKRFADAYYAARAIDDDDIAIASLINLIAVTTDGLPDHAAQETWMRTALADAERMTARAPQLAARIYANVAHYADLSGDLEHTKTWTAKARGLLVDHDPLVSDVLALEGSIQLETGHTDDGAKTYAKAIELEQNRLGPDHVRIAMMQSDFASQLLAGSRENDAMLVSQKAFAIISKLADRDDPIVADAKLTLGAIFVQLDQDAKAAPLLQEAKTAYIATYGARSPAVAKVDINMSVIENDGNRTAAAIALLEEALSIDEQLLGPDRIEIAEVLYNLIVAYRKTKDIPHALAAAKRTEAIFAAKSPGSARQVMAMAMLASVSNDAKDPTAALDLTSRALAMAGGSDQVKAWLELERGHALILLHRDPAEAKTNLAAARATYSALNMKARVDEIDRLAAMLH